MKRRELLQGFTLGGMSMLLPSVWSRPSFAGGVNFSLHDKVGQKVLLDSLNDPNFWKGVEVERPTGTLYDEFKLKKLDTGYLTYVSGEGGVDFTIEQVVQTVFNFQHKLPAHMAGAKAMSYIAKGTDPHFGVPYTDMFFMGDMDFFYCEYFQRMYRYDLEDGRTICAFERMTKQITGEERWKKYENIKDHNLNTVSMRWGLFNDVLPVTDVFGMYIVEPSTKTHTTRVTLTAKLRFGEGTGMLAQWGSEMPSLIRSGTLNGFNASVAIADCLRTGKYKMP